MHSSCIREAKASDASVLWTHCKALCQHHNQADTFALTESSLLDALASGTIQALVAIDQSCDRIIGSAIYSKTFSTWTGKTNIFLEHLFVDPSVRGQGQGRALLDALQLLTDGRIEFSVQETNHKSLKFYHDFGAEVHEDWLQMRLHGK